MHKKCKCGFWMSDTTVPNHTALEVSDESNAVSQFTIYHCECCHRLYIYPSRVDKHYYILALREVMSSFPESAEDNLSTIYILNDFDEEFKGYFAQDKRKLLLEYHDKTAVFLAEYIYDGDKIIYHDESPREILFDPALIDRSITADTVRCSCGWLINQKMANNDSAINLYNENSWIERVRGEFSWNAAYLKKMGHCCEKCSRFLLPIEKGQYSVYIPLNEKESVNAKFSFLWYFVKPSDEEEIPVGKYRKHVEDCTELLNQLNKIFISEDKKYLRVHEGDRVVFYQAEDIIPGLKCTELPQPS